MTTIREATFDDIADLERVRALVRENKLSTPIPRERIVAALEARGRGWVAVSDGEVVGFSMADREESSIWALFLLPEWEGRGLGRRLLDTAVGWLRAQGHHTIWLSTGAGTRAEGFYEHLGWRRTGVTASGEVRFELRGEPPDRLPRPQG
ncbi:MAG TPA: GNAT family N-acetyltransferase [Blastocatellia bacterium]|nr:GNAT family N-acetyltransferase [Blastocatellia bacterium]